MYRSPGLRATSAGLLSFLLFTACGKKDAQPDTSAATGSSSEDSAAQPQPSMNPQPSEPAANPTVVPLTKDDIARWEKGMDGELQAVKEAGAKLKVARNGEDTLNAMMGVQEMGTVEAGAKAAGVDPERYKFIRSNLSAVVGYLTPTLGGIDTTNLPPAQRDELRKGNEAQLQRMQQEVPADVVEALKPRAVELRKKNMELVGARLKGAGI
jgi:hypothetical protein